MSVMNGKRMSNEKDTRYGWFIVSLGGLTNLFGIGIPLMCMPVLFNEISAELDLSLVQIGAAWGMGGLASMIMTPFGGLIGDRFGVKRTVMIACILIGIAGGARGLSEGFSGLATTMFFYGLLQNTIVLNIHKSCCVWFSGKKMVIANGIVAAGIAMGMLLGALISNTIMSPLLGGWRNVLFLYGAVSIFMGLIWALTRNEPVHYDERGQTGPTPFRNTFRKVVRQRNIWIFGLAHFCYIGSIMGSVGYLPLYLRGIGWTPAEADGALAALNGAGMIGAIPLSILSARFGLRKGFIVPAVFITLMSMTILPFSHANFVWLLVILIGMVRDGYFAVLMTMVIETRGIGPAYAGTAMGIIFSLGNLGAFISSPTGNRLAVIRPEFAFLFWAALLGVSVLIFGFVKVSGESRDRSLSPEAVE